MYKKPNWFISNVANPVMQFFINRLGLSPQGAQVLEVRGRKSGKLYSVPVNPFEVDGHRYLFAPRGETQWVRNLRVAGEGTLRVGDKRHAFTVVRELANEEKPPLIRAYLDKYHWQVASQVAVPKDATLDQLAGIAHNHPVFEIRAVERA